MARRKSRSKTPVRDAKSKSTSSQSKRLAARVNQLNGSAAKKSVGYKKNGQSPPTKRGRANSRKYVNSPKVNNQELSMVERSIIEARNLQIEQEMEKLEQRFAKKQKETQKEIKAQKTKQRKKRGRSADKRKKKYPENTYEVESTNTVFTVLSYVISLAIVAAAVIYLYLISQDSSTDLVVLSNEVAEAIQTQNLSLSVLKISEHDLQKILIGSVFAGVFGFVIGSYRS